MSIKKCQIALELLWFTILPHFNSTVISFLLTHMSNSELERTIEEESCSTEAL